MQLVTVTNTIERVELVTVTNTVYEVKPEVDKALATARAVNTLANPTPYAPAIGAGLTGLSALLGMYARRKTKMLNAVIQGVEKGGNKDVKRAIQVEAIAQGVATALHAEVRKL